MSTVLLAEDDPDIRHLVSAKLLRSGFDVIETADGAEALAAIRRRRPDLVLIDLRMPRLEGLEVLRELRADPGTARLPVIVLTARTRGLDAQLGYAAGATDYIVKPFSPRELVRRVEDVLTRAGSP
ncbi:response regulator transcription factor [Actinoplanes sp. NPDC051343]|jgi:two-component system, OmpR family, phosphate regulon response regulator PhoB|uniref:response regulator transcription factor n=1 Tax=Actinoplanes sp. NPDC051343 TaxID=3363906 RepID=UPI0037A7FA9B